MKILNIIHYTFILLLACSSGYAQDSISFYQKLKSQYDAERDFKTNIYYNPAYMLDYGSFSSSELSVNYSIQKDKVYRLQNGSKHTEFNIATNSFQKLNSNQALWGSASYQNKKMKDIKFNENLDYERVAPYISSDSVGGNIDAENYHFLGGYSHKLNKVTLGAQASYNAQLGSRSRDPRLRNTTSELNVKIGINYAFNKKLDIALFVEGEKYLQNNQIRFASKLGQPLIFQMTGLGYYNNLFSGGTSSLSTQNEEYLYKIGGQLIHNKGKDFYILAQLGQAEQTKSYNGTTSRYYDIADLNKNYFEIEAAKFFQFHQNRVGFKINYLSNQLSGKEYGYTNNTQLIEKIYKRLSYKKDESYTSFSLIFTMNKDQFNLSVNPYYRYHQVKEQRMYPFSGQKFDYSIVGLNLDYKQPIKDNQLLTLRPFVEFKSVSSSKNALTSSSIATINTWMKHDYAYLASDIQSIGINARYDIQLEKIPALFFEAGYSQIKIQSNNNTFSTVSVGITF